MNDNSIGIPEPKTAVEAKEAETAEGMRIAMRKAALRDPIIYRGLETAKYRGLSGEDTYTLIAYHALRALHDLHEQHNDLLKNSPQPFMVLPTI